jgi:ubiquinol-cytochrome c reductase cytochrome b subunit
MKELKRRAETDLWARLFGEMAIYSFIVTAVTGVYLMFFYRPALTPVTYHGSYRLLDGTQMSRAYQSTLGISFDQRAGLLIRQMHGWAALLFCAAVCLVLVRLFFTGSFARRRLYANWLIWVTLLVLGIAAGLSGSLLPDDTMSGGSLDVLEGVTLSIPLAGTRLAALIFGSDFPGHVVVERAYWLHVAVLPAVMLALFALRRRAAREREPRMRQVSVPLFFFTAAVLAALGAFAQINPVWLYGPYQPASISAGAVPSWYLGFLDGALRIMPGWEISIAGHPLTLAILVPALIVPGVFFTVLAIYPLIEPRLLTGAGQANAAIRAGIGAAGITFYGLLWAAAANDEIAYHLSVSLYTVTWIFRVAVLAGPPLMFELTRRLCLGLALRRQDEAEHGIETGRIVMSPEGGFTEIREPAGTGVTAGSG